MTGLRDVAGGLFDVATVVEEEIGLEGGDSPLESPRRGTWLRRPLFQFISVRIALVHEGAACDHQRCGCLAGVPSCCSQLQRTRRAKSLNGPSGQRVRRAVALVLLERGQAGACW